MAGEAVTEAMDGDLMTSIEDRHEEAGFNVMEWIMQLDYS